MNVDDVMSAAVEAAGTDDFGPDTFVEGLSVLCASADGEAQLNEIGRFALEQNIIGGLVNRLKITDWVRQHPDVVLERIEAPLIVVGMFRAGTTFLSQLLDQDPDPDEAAIRKALAGNVCRCTGYINIIAAVRAAAERMLRERGPDEH